MDAPLLVDHNTVMEEMRELWPMPGNVWYEVVAEAMLEAGIHYPGEHLAWDDELGAICLSGEIDSELGSRMLDVAISLRERYEDLYEQNLSVDEGTYTNYRYWFFAPYNYL